MPDKATERFERQVGEWMRRGDELVRIAWVDGAIGCLEFKKASRRVKVCRKRRRGFDRNKPEA